MTDLTRGTCYAVAAVLLMIAPLPLALGQSTVGAAPRPNANLVEWESRVPATALLGLERLGPGIELRRLIYRVETNRETRNEVPASVWSGHSTALQSAPASVVTPSEEQLHLAVE